MGQVHHALLPHFPRVSTISHCTVHENRHPALHTMAKTNSEKRHIVFVHPDLGIGGAERLVIDAAVGLQSLGHKVTILTSHCDPKHCFEEARDGE